MFSRPPHIMDPNSRASTLLLLHTYLCCGCLWGERECALFVWCWLNSVVFTHTFDDLIGIKGIMPGTLVMSRGRLGLAMELTCCSCCILG